MAVKKEYIQWFDSESDAWKFVVTWYKLHKMYSKNSTMAVEFYTGKWWVVLKVEEGV